MGGAHSFNACAAGMRCTSIVSITSIAADSLAAGVISDFQFESGRNRLSDKVYFQYEIDPHCHEHNHAPPAVSCRQTNGSDQSP